MNYHVTTVLFLVVCGSQGDAADLWQRHTIDDSSRGADGVRMADVNGDGYPDITTGWEEGGVIRVYLNPGPRSAADPWQAVTVGNVKSPEDALFVDLDGDGAFDVVSSCEGGTKTIFIHWAPKAADQYLNADAWQTQAISCTENRQSWMFALPMDVDGRNGLDLIVGSKGDNASIGWLESPTDPRDVTAWKFHRLRDAGWIMSLVAHDVDGDGDLDVVASDRKGAKRGVFWLQNPGPNKSAAGHGWVDTEIGGGDRENMFLDVQRDKSGSTVVFSAVKPAGIMKFELAVASRTQHVAAAVEDRGWVSHAIELPAKKIGTGKSVRSADLNLDGHEDLVYSCEEASGSKQGVVWVKVKETDVEVHPISGPEGVKFDLIQLLDLDADGDLDVVTCEERANLGVFWYENPTR